MLTNIILTTCLSLALSGQPAADTLRTEGIVNYEPTAEVLAAREDFRDSKFGVFIHWGVYSMMARGEWVMHDNKIPYADYSILPGGFCPSKFNAAEWVSAIKGAGARYITITSRHHDGFSMFATKASPYNIVDATPYGRDILKDLADECAKQGVTLNFYYSLVDWGREDYPIGRDGNIFGKDESKINYASYLDFMCAQMTELLTNYGKVGCIWFDGDWDMVPKPEPGKAPVVTFDWGYERLYSHIHSVQNGTLVANNHHRIPLGGEDIQVFERDVPGENNAGYSRTSVVSQALPLETCQTMNKCWGYDITDHNYKSTEQLIRSLVRTAGRNANLLLNIGPQPDGRIPAEALKRFAQMGEWLAANGETIYGTRATMLKPQPWGVLTHKDNRIWLHVSEYPEGGVITLPFTLKAKAVTAFASGEKLQFKKTKTNFTVNVPEGADCTVDYIIEIQL